MPFSDEQKGRMPILLADYNGDLVNQAAAGRIVKSVRCPRAVTLERIDLRYETEGGTTPAATVAVRRSTTAVLTVTADTNATQASDAAVEADQSLQFEMGDQFNLFLTTANDDNDFTGLSCQVWGVLR